MALLLWMAPNRELLDLIRRLASLFREGNQGQTPESGYGVAGALAQLIWLHRTPWLPLQLYLAICLASHLSPGLADLKGALPGAIFAACLLGLTCAVLAWQRVSLAGIPVVLAPMILLVLASALFQGSYVLGVWGVLRVLRSGRGRKAAPRRCRAG